MNEILKEQAVLQDEAEVLLGATNILELLGRLGKVTRTGSSVTGLMAYTDIDFAVQNERPDFDQVIMMIPEIYSVLGAKTVKITDFRDNADEAASFYIGFDIPYGDKTWHIDATVTHPGPIGTNPPQLAGWLQNMSDEQRTTIVDLKKQLIQAGRYVGARSRPPFTFRSAHLYEAVLKGCAKTISEIEEYFTLR